MNILLEIVSAFIIVFCEAISWFKITDKKINKDNKKLYTVVIIIAVFQILNYHFVNNFVKSIGIMISFVIGSKILLQISVKKSIIIAFLCEIMVIILEAVYVILMSLFFSVDTINNSVIITFFADIFIGILLYFVFSTNLLKKIYKGICDITNQVKLYQMSLFLALVMFSLSTIFAYIYLDKNVPLLLIINISLSVIYTVIVILVLNYQNRYYKVNINYQNSLDYLQAQESIIDEYRIINHENKNQLLTIKSMTKDKKVINYVNTLIEQKENFKNEIINSILQLPEGGIRGLVYSKILYMKENNITCNLNIDRNISVKTFKNINDNDTVIICEILGVFIDNAIEEVDGIKNKIINIGMYLDNNVLEISITNAYESMLNIVDGNNALSSTKGNNHGYGLKLVKKLIAGNNKLMNETEITKDTFKQNLLVKL